MRCRLAIFALTLLNLPAFALAQDPAPRYLATIQGELEAMELAPACEALSATRARCSFLHVTSGDARRELMVHVLYSEVTDTVYLYIPRVVSAPPELESTSVLLRRMMEINWTMLAGKLEWNSASGEVRLSSLLHTDSNFDRRAFRSLVRALLRDGERYARELSRMSEQADP